MEDSACRSGDRLSTPVNCVRLRVLKASRRTSSLRFPPSEIDCEMRPVEPQVGVVGPAVGLLAVGPLPWARTLSSSSALDDSSSAENDSSFSFDGVDPFGVPGGLADGGGRSGRARVSAAARVSSRLSSVATLSESSVFSRPAFPAFQHVEGAFDPPPGGRRRVSCHFPARSR
jgi:hypothetical protein